MQRMENRSFRKGFCRVGLELLVPCGSMEGAKLAVENGANAVYAGVTNLSMRPKRVEFSIENSLTDLVKYVHENGVRLFAALNIYMKSQDEDLFKRSVDEVVTSKADAIILSDIGAIRYVRQNYPELPVHVSICTSVTNAEAARFYEDLGASVVVVSRSLDDLDEIKKIRESVDVDLELFVHGGICYMYDGDCYLSSHYKQVWNYDKALGAERLFGQNNTKGECQLICKRNCALTLEGETLAEGRLLRRPDQVGLHNLPFYIDNGINILKIEGRAMPLEYVAQATKLYREAIDLYLQDKEAFKVKDNWLPVIDRLIEARHEYERKWHIR